MYHYYMNLLFLYVCMLLSYVLTCPLRMNVLTSWALGVGRMPLVWAFKFKVTLRLTDGQSGAHDQILDSV
jgi:hypothetical protein